MLLYTSHPIRLPRGPDGCAPMFHHHTEHDTRSKDTMRTYEITRGDDLTRTLYVHTDGRVVEETPGLYFPEGYLPDSRVIGKVERRIKPGTKSSREYRAVPSQRRAQPVPHPGLWHRTLERAVEDLECLTRKQYLAETRCELAVPTPEVEPEQPVEVVVTVTPQALATVDDAVEFLAACKLASRQRKLQVDTFRFNGRVYLIETTGEHTAEVDRADDVFDQYTTTIDLRTIEVAAELDDDEPQLVRDVDTGQIVLLNVDEYERAQLTRQHLDEWHDC